MQYFCTRCGNPRPAGDASCAWCGREFDQPAAQVPDHGDPDGGRVAGDGPAGPPAYPEPLTSADASIPVYEEPQPTTWDYTLPSDSGPQSWGVGYYDEPQRLTADARNPFWGVFSAPPAPPAEPGGTSPPSWQAPQEPAPHWLVPPQSSPQEPGAQPVPAQPAARQPASHRLVPARPATRGRRRPALPRPSGTLAAAAVLLVLAFGGGAYALVTTLTGHSGKPSGHPPAAAGLSTSAAAQTSSLPPATPPGSPPAATATSPVASPTASATTAPPAPATQPPATQPPAAPPQTTPPAPSGAVPVSVSQAAQSDSAEPQVLAWVERYFTAINDHDYQAYVSLLDAHDAANESPADFASGYSTTTDSAITLTRISDLGSGGEAASVSFTSRQAPRQSIDGSSCDLWSITLYLTPGGSSYVRVSPPPGYRSSHGAC